MADAVTGARAVCELCHDLHVCKSGSVASQSQRGDSRLCGAVISNIPHHGSC